jgi:hypothetical protein
MAKATPPLVTSHWGTPDPRDANAYPKATSSTPMTQWAWEFLRRRSDYRVRWERLVKPFLNEQRQEFDQEAIDRHHEATVISARRECRAYSWRAPYEALRDEFRVSTDSAHCNVTLDPRLERPPLFDGTFIKEVQQHPDVVKLPKVLLEFDVQLSLELQLENARKVLARRAKPYARRAVKLPIAKFPRYLRLLDFQDANVKDKEIGDHLFPNHSGEQLRDTIRKNFGAAFSWQDDYLIVALHRPASS